MIFPTLMTDGRSAALFRFEPIFGLRMTSALSFLSRNTVPVPPRPACFRRTAPRLGSYHEKLRQPM